MSPALDALWDRVKDEPALVAGLVGITLITAQEFGLNLTAGQETSLNALTMAVLAFLVRRKVVPSRRVEFIEEDAELPPQ